MTVITRFAPSPTGFLHIGGARTALFNWLFARHNKGKLLLRIEDTDRARSTPEAVKAIFEGLEWFGLDFDAEPVFQFSQAERHQEVAHALLEAGKAYRCYCSPQELETMKEQARQAGRPPLYDGRWRDRSPFEAPTGVSPVIRLKTPREGEIVLEDLVQGTVRVQNDQLDDMVLLRSDGTPTYMLSVVVDDHDMGITHVIRGDDHLTNTFRQAHIYQAMGWSLPRFSHIPLIHGADGAKLSKRHGALGIETYRDQGFLPEALRNYLLRLGWGHGDDEIISTEQAIAWFSLEAVGRAPARFDLAKLTHINAHYLRQADNKRLVELVASHFSDAAKERLLRGMDGLKQRARTVIELVEAASIYTTDEVQTWDEAVKALLTSDALSTLKIYAAEIKNLSSWTAENLEAIARQCAETQGIKLGQLAQPLRAATTGKTVSPPIFQVLEILGPDLTRRRLNQVLL